MEASAKRRVIEFGAMAIVCALGGWTTLVNAISLHELSYNEGWNIYNAVAFGTKDLYPPHLALTSSNYPMLSFGLFSILHHVTHDYLFTGRAVSVLSLAGICFFVRQICRNLGTTSHASRFAAFFCLALFTINNADALHGSLYVGADDPNMLALCLGAGGLSFYLSSLKSRRAWLPLLFSALMFTLSLSVKHTLLDFPAVVLLNQMVRSRRRGTVFLFVLGGSVLGSFALQNWAGGSGFIPQMLAPRTYTPGHAIGTFIDLFGPMLVPALIALMTALLIVKNSLLRILPSLLVGSLVLGFYTGRADGVSYNCFFSAELVCVLLIGVFVSKLERREWLPDSRGRAEWVPTLLFLWFLIPLILFTTWNPWTVFLEARIEQAAFREEVRFIRDSSGPALCESLLRCYLADKPYVYDPFNATRLIRAGKLSDAELISSVQQRKYGRIELTDPVASELAGHSERFTPALLQAIQASYQLTYENHGESIYKPR